MQKDQSRCTSKITSPESVTTYWGRRRKLWHVPQKLSLKQELYSYLVIIMYDQKKKKKKKINTIFYDNSISSGQCACKTIQMGAMMIRFGQDFYEGGGIKDKDDRGPPDSSLQAVCSAISCCFISHFVDVIRRTNIVCSWQGRTRVIPISEMT